MRLTTKTEKYAMTEVLKRICDIHGDTYRFESLRMPAESYTSNTHTHILVVTADEVAEVKKIC